MIEALKQAAVTVVLGWVLVAIGGALISVQRPATMYPPSVATASRR